MYNYVKVVDCEGLISVKNTEANIAASHELARAVDGAGFEIDAVVNMRTGERLLIVSGTGYEVELDEVMSALGKVAEFIAKAGSDSVTDVKLYPGTGTQLKVFRVSATGVDSCNLMC